MNNAVHYSRAQLVHDLYHGFVIVLEGKTFIYQLFLGAIHAAYLMSTVLYLSVSQGCEQAADFS